MEGLFNILTPHQEEYIFHLHEIKPTDIYTKLETYKMKHLLIIIISVLILSCITLIIIEGV